MQQNKDLNQDLVGVWHTEFRFEFEFEFIHIALPRVAPRVRRGPVESQSITQD
jgi:hypothetical protein